jgi:peptide/nickel transport system permease protein
MENYRFFMNRGNYMHTRYQKMRALIKEEPLGVGGALLCLLLLVISFGVPLFVHLDPTTTTINRAFAPPSTEFWLGADYLGRDVLTRFIFGARTSLIVGMTSVVLASVLGGVIGILSGYIGGSFDLYLQRLVDALLALPALVLAIIIMAVLGNSVLNAIIAIAISYAPRINRLTRSSAMSIKNMPYIESAAVAGCSKFRIVLWHIAPNCVAPWIVYATALLSTAFVAEATLSFLGLGVPPPVASWGRDLSENLGSLESYPWLCLVPGFGIVIAVYAANFLGDSIRNIVDPRLKKI